MLDAHAIVARHGNILDPSLRSLRSTGAAEFVPFDRYGDTINGMKWCPLSIGEDDDLGIYLLQMAPGAQTYPHEHTGCEQFFVLEGSLTDCDGQVITAGTFARFEAGSKHHSKTEHGCLLLVIMRQRNRGLDSD